MARHQINFQGENKDISSDLLPKTIFDTWLAYEIDNLEFNELVRQMLGVEP